MKHLFFLFRFPKDALRRKRWFINLRRDNFKVTNHSKICSKHFTPDSFDREKFGATWLKKDAVPTLFDFPKHVTEKELKPIDPIQEDVHEKNSGEWLKNNSIPTLFYFPKHLTEKESKQTEPSQEDIQKVYSPLVSKYTF